MGSGSPRKEAPPQPRPPAKLWALLDSPDHQALRARHVGEALLMLGLIDERQLREACQAQREQRRLSLVRPLGELLVDRGAISEMQLRQAIAAWLGSRVIDPTHVPFDPAALARTYEQPTTPTAAAGPAAATARAKPAARELLADLQQVSDIGAEQAADIVSKSDNSLVRLVHTIIEEASAHKASDIHIETESPPKPVRVRLRIDGELVRYLEIDARFRYALVARIKIMAGMDISEHRKPQDGKIDCVDCARFGGPRTELRVVTMPTTGGLEDVVLRLLAGSKPMPLLAIRLAPRDLAQVIAATNV